MPESPALMSQPTTIAHYRITAKLGEGGMGEVWRATDTKLGRDVAIKVLPESFSQDSDRMARFEREAKVLAALNHPNIASIYGIEERALVMELVEGETLKGPVSVETALDYARQTAEALEAAHEKGIIHRDLKPANIKVTPQGVVKVLDFGLAAVTHSSASGDPSISPTLTISPSRAGMILGTAAYMSPEQARGKAVDKRADIWAFGVGLVEMLTGKQLFSGDTAAEILASVMKEPVSLDLLPADTPPAIRHLIGRCLERDLRRRLQHIGEARIALEGPLTAPPEIRAAPKRQTTGLAALAALLLLALAGLAFVHFREAPSPQNTIRFQVLLPEKSASTAFKLSPDARSTSARNT